MSENFYFHKATVDVAVKVFVEEFTERRKRSSQISGQTDVLLDFNTKHNFTALSLPLQLNYYPAFMNSSFGIGFGLRPTYLIAATSGIHSVISHHSDIDAINNESISEYVDVRRFNIGVGINLMYNLDLTDEAGININVGYQNYLLDFYAANDFSSSVHRLSFSTGFYHKF